MQSISNARLVTVTLRDILEEQYPDCVTVEERAKKLGITPQILSNHLLRECVLTKLEDGRYITVTGHNKVLDLD